MRPILRFLPLILIPAMALPAFTAPAVSPTPGPIHLVQAIRPGQGQPRVLGVAPVNPASTRALSRAASAGRTRPYQTPKPGEGAAKD
jgi:hypothetical protein